MSTGDNRRFTDREVAIVLRKASEMEEKEGDIGGGGGLSLKDLEEIAAEVGISRTVLSRAVSQLDARGRGGNPLAGGPLAHRAIQAVPGELDQESVARLVRHVDGGSDAVGVVTEALGATQWTSADRFRTTQVSITPAKGETTIQVVGRATRRLRRMLHVAPAFLGGALVAGSIGALDPSSGVVAACIALGAALGAGVGRFAWGRLSARNAARVEQLAEELSEQAAQAAGKLPDPN